jgi:hypothetical protein
MSDITTWDSINEEQLNAQITNRQYKDTLFRALFKDKKRFIELYNAIANENYPESAEIIPCPINPVMAMFNDLAFYIESKLIVMCEQQSTINPNMPLRFLFYISDVLRTSIIKKDSLYRRTLVQIPTPEFFVLFNGKQKLEDYKMNLSDAFLLKDRESTLELTVKVININYNSGENAIMQSVTLSGYSFLIEEVERNISGGMIRDEAIRKAITTCINQGVLVDFLEGNFMEVFEMLTFEYDQEAERRAMRLDGIQEGKLEGKLEGLQEGKLEGKMEGKRDIVLYMISKGKTIDEISDLTGVPKTELQHFTS